MFRYTDSVYLGSRKPKPSLLHATNIEDTREEQKLTRGLFTANRCVEYACYIAALKKKPDILFLFVHDDNSMNPQPTGYTTLCRVLIRAGYSFYSALPGPPTFPNLYAWPNNPACNRKDMEEVVKLAMDDAHHVGKTFEVLILYPYIIDTCISDAYTRLCAIYDEVESFTFII